MKIDPPRSFEIEEGFANESGEPTAKMPATHMRISFDSVEGGTRMTNLSTFPSRAAMDQLLAMGMDEGLKAALGQMDDVLGA